VSDRPYVSFAEVKEKVPIPDVLETLGIADGFKRKGDAGHDHSFVGKTPAHPLLEAAFIMVLGVEGLANGRDALRRRGQDL
jgi:hypothetical protein